MAPSHSFDHKELQLGAGNRAVMFSFWTGALPESARLHFLTATKYLPHWSRYVLFTYNAAITRSAADEMKKLGIILHEIDFPQLLKQAGLSGRWLRRDLQRIIHKFPKLLRPQLGHDHPVMGFSPRFNLLFGWPMYDAAMVSNYARVILSSILPLQTIYTDIDFAFTRALEWAFTKGSFVYRWEQYAFANSALLAVEDSCSIKRGRLLETLRKEGTPSPWILFSEKNCRECGLEILPCDRLDPMWSVTNPSSRNFREFIECHDNSRETLVDLQRNFDAIHWHGKRKWAASPQRGSPYDLWITELTA